MSTYEVNDKLLASAARVASQLGGWYEQGAWRFPTVALKEQFEDYLDRASSLTACE